MIIDPAFALLIIACGALLFGSSAAHKLRVFAQFTASVREYRVLSAVLIKPAAVAITLCELLISAGLSWAAIELVARGGLRFAPAQAVAAAGSILLLIYAGAILVNLLRGRRELDCGCSGFGRHDRIAPWMVLRNLVLAGLFCIMQLPVATRSLVPVDGLTVVGGLSIATMLYVTCETLFGQVAAFGVRTVSRS